MSTHNTKTSLFNFPFDGLARLSNAFFVCALFFLSSNALAYNCANSTSTGVYETTGEVVIQNGEWQSSCSDGSTHLVFEMGMYEFFLQPLIAGIGQHQSTYLSGGSLLVSQYNSALSQYADGDVASSMPEPEQIATSFGAGFIIGLPLFVIVFGARVIMRMLR